MDAPITGGGSSVCSGVPRVEIEASVVVVVPESLAGLGARVANARSPVARKTKPSLCSGSIARKAWASRLTASQSYLGIASSASSRRRSIRRCSPSLAMMGILAFEGGVVYRYRAWRQGLGIHVFPLGAQLPSGQTDWDYNAFKKDKVGKRVGRRVAGKAIGKAMRKLFK